MSELVSYRVTDKGCQWSFLDHPVAGKATEKVQVAPSIYAPGGVSQIVRVLPILGIDEEVQASEWIACFRAIRR